MRLVQLYLFFLLSYIFSNWRVFGSFSIGVSGLLSHDFACCLIGLRIKNLSTAFFVPMFILSTTLTISSCSRDGFRNVSQLRTIIMADWVQGECVLRKVMEKDLQQRRKVVDIYAGLYSLWALRITHLYWPSPLEYYPLCIEWQQNRQRI